MLKELTDNIEISNLNKKKTTKSTYSLFKDKFQRTAQTEQRQTEQRQTNERLNQQSKYVQRQ